MMKIVIKFSVIEKILFPIVILILLLLLALSFLYIIWAIINSFGSNFIPLSSKPTKSLITFSFCLINWKRTFNYFPWFINLFYTFQSRSSNFINNIQFFLQYSSMYLFVLKTFLYQLNFYIYFLFLLFFLLKN